MVSIKRYYVPDHVLCGFPPKRLTTVLDLYPNGLVVGLPPETDLPTQHPLQPIVFGSFKDAVSAHRQSVEDALTWPVEDVDVIKLPCPRCMMLTDDEINGHMASCPVRVEMERRLSSMADQLDAETRENLSRPTDTFVPRMFTSEAIGEDGDTVVEIDAATENGGSIDDVDYPYEPFDVQPATSVEPLEPLELPLEGQRLVGETRDFIANLLGNQEDFSDE